MTTTIMKNSLTLLKPGGAIAQDNVFLFDTGIGRDAVDAVVHERIALQDTQAMRALNEKIKHDTRILPLVDGL